MCSVFFYSRQAQCRDQDVANTDLSRLSDSSPEVNMGLMMIVLGADCDPLAGLGVAWVSGDLPS